ncbi:MAG: peptidoglycan editing factor PgeF [Methylophilaceae bacterium]
MRPNKIKVDWIVPEKIKSFQSVSSFKLTRTISSNSSDEYQKIFKSVGLNFSLINQVHSNQVYVIHKNTHNLTGDSVITFKPNVVVAIRTADCIPILLTDKNGSFVAAIHCGWRGLSEGIIQNTINKINSKDFVAWIGPGISMKNFETDRDVYDAFMKKNNHLTRHFRYKNYKFNVDLLGITRDLLHKSGVHEVYGNSLTQDYCTYRDHDFLFSYRFNQTPFRLISLAWIKP